jgi:hypothetical protein
VNFSDPFGLCVPWCTAVAGAVGFGGIRLAANLIQGRPWHENVGRDAAIGGAIGLTLGAAAPALLPSAATSVAARTGGPELAVQFGKGANQIYHAFRHTDKLGLDRERVQAAVQQHLQSVASQLTAGKPLNQVIEVDGVRVQYTAYLVADGVANVGRIHGVR